MSFDVFVQGFAAGDAADLDATKVLAALASLADSGDVVVADPTRGCMITRVTPEAEEAIVRLLAHADAVAMWPAEEPTAAIGRPGKAVDLPEEVTRVVVVRTRADLIRAIEES